MPNIKTEWSSNDWNNIEKLGNELVSITFEMNERIGSGGGCNNPDDLINTALAAERILAKLKVVISNY